jgi:hypothetical protein
MPAPITITSQGLSPACPALAEAGTGIRVSDLIESIHQEYKEHEDLPNTTNPDDWAKISGKKGERIVYVRTLVHRDVEPGSHAARRTRRNRQALAPAPRLRRPRRCTRRRRDDHRTRIHGPGPGMTDTRGTP